ncbi:hypothetical protein [Mumia sp. DW29H23]|uniref:hypothetical protein n=1 Tax=Mumia sp. DW29H23 TaxID=3421241 RepID=UPI003D681644
MTTFLTTYGLKSRRALARLISAGAEPHGRELGSTVHTFERTDELAAATVPG